MIYTSLTNKAMQIAYTAHHGQVDKGGVPYIFHPFHLAEQMTDEYSVCTALLHDVVEDTTITLEELKQIFPCEVTDALALLTHQKGTDYFTYVTAIKANPIARTVKLADLKHNTDASRLPAGDPSSVRRWEEKYRQALEILR